MEISGITPPGVEIKEISWNPVNPTMLAVVFTNGSMALYLIKTDGSKFDTSTLPPGEGITCVSWSPKGKKEAHALKKYDQFALNTSCFWGYTGSNITPVVQFHEIFVTN